jgi:hypothetical protein
MRRREEERQLERLFDAVERNDDAEVTRIRAELGAREAAALVDLELDAERTARKRADGGRMLDRVRNVFQAALLDGFLRRFDRRGDDLRH